MLYKTPVTTLQRRRQQLAQLFPDPILLWAGTAPPRNFAANLYPFRASSHFIYFCGSSIENAVIGLENGKLYLFMNEPHADAALWHGGSDTIEEIGCAIAADAIYDQSKLTQYARGAVTIPHPDCFTRQQQCQVFGSQVNLNSNLAEAIVAVRLCHDDEAIEQMRQAAVVSVEAHLAGMRATPTAKTEAEVRAAMENRIIAHNLTCAYGSIVTVHGEVLHNQHYHNSLQPGDLLLADVGAESEGGWASDITRTWPVSGRFSSTQKDIYDVVLAAHDRCIDAIKPGVEYRDVHRLAAETITAGLVDLGILRGKVEDLLAIDAHALFFPHGVGHLLGLDVHDMEDLGDVAGYAEGRTRSDRLGWRYLRLNRLLQARMVVTIEPGFYQVPAILHRRDVQQQYGGVVDWQRLAQFSDVRGIRIEDDVFITPDGTEVLTAALPTQSTEIELLICQ